MAAYRRVMSSVTFGLTAEDRDQLRNPTLVSSMGLPYYYTYLHIYLLTSRCRCAAQSWMPAAGVVDGPDAQTSWRITSMTSTSPRASGVSPHPPPGSAHIHRRHHRRRHRYGGDDRVRSLPAPLPRDAFSISIVVVIILSITIVVLTLGLVPVD